MPIVYLTTPNLDRIKARVEKAHPGYRLDEPLRFDVTNHPDPQVIDLDDSQGESKNSRGSGHVKTPEFTYIAGMFDALNLDQLQQGLDRLRAVVAPTCTA